MCPRLFSGQQSNQLSSSAPPARNAGAVLQAQNEARTRLNDRQGRNVTTSPVNDQNKNNRTVMVNL